MRPHNQIIKAQEIKKLPMPVTQFNQRRLIKFQEQNFILFIIRGTMSHNQEIHTNNNEIKWR